MNRALLIAVSVVAALSVLAGGLYWFAGIVRKAERAEAANNTIKELVERGKLNANTSKLDRAGICHELDLDFVPERNECE